MRSIAAGPIDGVRQDYAHGASVLSLMLDLCGGTPGYMCAKQLSRTST